MIDTPPAELPPSYEPLIRIMAMPKDTNPSGDVFGGWLMSLMDLAAGTAAARRAQGRCVTVSLDSMSFLVPVKVGDGVSVYARVTRVGRSSMSIGVQAWRRPPFSEASIKVTDAVFTFVALDAQGRPRPVPPE